MKDTLERLAILVLGLLACLLGLFLTIALIILADISRTEPPAVAAPPPPIEKPAPVDREPPREFTIPNYAPNPDATVRT